MVVVTGEGDRSYRYVLYVSRISDKFISERGELDDGYFSFLKNPFRQVE